MDADANAGGSTIALRELYSGELINAFSKAKMLMLCDLTNKAMNHEQLQAGHTGPHDNVENQTWALVVTRLCYPYLGLVYL